MKLFGSTRSPYVRKVLVCAHETGLVGEIALVPVVVSFLQANDEVARHNPVGQIPTLVLDDGEAVADSRVICAYLAERAPTAGLVPADARARRAAQVREAMADNLLTAFIRWYGERRRAADPLSPEIVAGCRRKMTQVLDAWEREAPDWPDRLDVGLVAIGCAIAYADFRFAGEPWRPGRDRLAAWYAGVSERPSFAATAFRDG